MALSGHKPMRSKSKKPLGRLSQSITKKRSMTLDHFFVPPKVDNKRGKSVNSTEFDQTYQSHRAVLSANSPEAEFQITLSSLAKWSKSNRLSESSGVSNSSNRKTISLDTPKENSGIQSFFSSITKCHSKVSTKLNANKTLSNPPKAQVATKIDVNKVEGKSNKELDGCNVSQIISEFDEDIEDIDDISIEENEQQNVGKKEEATLDKDHSNTCSSRKVNHEIKSSFKSSIASNNILWALTERSICTNHRRMRLLTSLHPTNNHSDNAKISLNPKYSPSPKPINEIIRQRSFVRNRISVCPTVQFGTDKFSHSASVNHIGQICQKGRVTSMEYDSKGILLAVANSQGSILVYDFDELTAIDLKFRNIANHNHALDEWKKFQTMKKHTNKTKLSVDTSVESTSCSSNHDISHAVLHNDDESKTMDSTESHPATYKLNYNTQLLKPIVEFKTNKHINSIKWNPDDENQVAVSFMCHHEVKIFDLSVPKLRSVLSFTNSNDSREDREGNNSLLFISMQPQYLHDSNKGTQFLRRNTRLLVGSNCGIVRMWAVSNARSSKGKKILKPKLVWSVNVFSSQTYRFTEAVSDMVLLGPDYRTAHDMKSVERVNSKFTGFLIVGGNMGTIVLVDTIRCVRKAFSTCHTPTVLRRYSIANIFLSAVRSSSFSLPPDPSLGIKKLCVWNHPLSIRKFPSDSNVENQTASHDSSLATRQTLADDILRQSALSVVTNSGWTAKVAFGFNENERKDKGMVLALHKTKNVLSVDMHDNTTEKLAWSLPEVPCPGWPMHGSSLLCIGDVPQQLDVLPDRDDRVADNNVRVQLEKRENALLFVDTGNILLKRKKSIAMEVTSKLQISGTPSEIIVHPSEEWIVVGYAEEGKLELLSIRDYILS